MELIEMFQFGANDCGSHAEGSECVFRLGEFLRYCPTEFVSPGSTTLDSREEEGSYLQTTLKLPRGNWDTRGLFSCGRRRLLK
jgi:hypothetical protein